MPYSLIFIILFSNFSIALKSQKKNDFAVDKIDKAISKNARIVVRTHDTNVVLKSKDHYTVAHHKVLTIRNKKGLENGALRIFYKEGTEKVKDIKITIYDEEGEILKKVKEKEVEDYVARDGMSLISDGRIKYYRYEPTSYPITFQYSWVEESSSTLSLPMWAPIQSSYTAIEHSSYKIENKSKIPIRISPRNIAQYNIKKEGELHYVMSDQPVVKAESYSPSVYEYSPFILAAPTSYKYEGYEGTYETWKEFGSWIHDELLSAKADLSKSESREAIDKILTDKEDKRKIIEDIYNYVQENTRYILIGLDEGGLVPLSTKKVHDVKYGDCKALSFYMKALLEAYDIESNYVIIRADSDMPEDIFEDFPHVAPANHIILNVPMSEDTIWLDCTSHTNPFNFLGSFTDDRLALSVNKEGGQLVRTPIYDQDQNKTYRKGEIKIDEKGDISAQLVIDEFGIKIDKATYLKKLNPKKLNEYLSNNLFSKLDQLVVNDHSITISEDSIKTREVYNITASRYAESAGGYLIFKSAFLSMGIPRFKKNNQRSNDVVFPRSEVNISDISYEYPANYRMKLPEPILYQSKYGSYSRTVEHISPNASKIIRKFELNKGQYSHEEYSDIKLFFDKIRKAERTQFSISNKT